MTHIELLNDNNDVVSMKIGLRCTLNYKNRNDLKIYYFVAALLHPLQTPPPQNHNILFACYE